MGMAHIKVNEETFKHKYNIKICYYKGSNKNTKTFFVGLVNYSRIFAFPGQFWNVAPRKARDDLKLPAVGCLNNHEM